MGNSARQSADNLAWDRYDESEEPSRDKLRRKTICRKVEKLVQSVLQSGPATFETPILTGSFHALYRLRIQDYREGTVCVRVPIPNQGIFPEEKTRAEAATARYLTKFSTLRVPEVFHQGTDPDLGPYVIMQDLGPRRRTMCDPLKAPPKGGDDNPDDHPDDRYILNPNISDPDLKRLWIKMAQCVYKLAQPALQKIGALAETSPGVFHVLGRPLTFNMTNMFHLANVPLTIFPPEGTTYQTADEWYVALADMQLATLLFQHNDMVVSEDDCRDKYVARHLFRKLAKQGRLSKFGFSDDDWSAGSRKSPPTLPAPDGSGSFRLWCDDFRPSNVLIDDADDVLGVIDWEFAYAAPTQFSLDCPWWLLIEAPETWDAGIDDWIDKYNSRLEIWLSAMEEVERDSLGSSEKESLVLESHSPPTDTLRLSAYMRESWSTRRFWLNYAARKSWAFDHVYWNYLDERFFGDREWAKHTGDDASADANVFWKTRIDLLSEEERRVMEILVKIKMSEANDRRLVEWSDELARDWLETFLF